MKSVLITGGTGSFGQAFVAEVIRRFPKIRRLVVFSRDELKQFEMAQRFPESKHKNLRFFIGDVRDRNRLRRALEGIDTVVHAAALKQVPAAEYNPMEFIHTNVLGALALGAQRLLPVLQQGYSSYVIMRGADASLRDTLALVDQPLPDQAADASKTPLPFASSIELKQLGFRYGPQLPWVLRGVDLEIRRGSCIGFIGTTGVGKSTLFDVIMGLLPPTEGILAIDGVPVALNNQRPWQTHLAHVPQNVYLADTSIAENIAFGVPRASIDFHRVRQAAMGAQIAHTIESMPEQYLTTVGERGARLSGGQRQRIGIARALYKNADVIILDEATSALDDETERSVMEVIHSLGKNITILMIAHRLSSLRKCDQIFQLYKGGLRLLENSKEPKSEFRSI